MAATAITITLEVKELMFDVQNMTYLTGRSREAANNGDYQSAANMQASDDEENSYQIRRSINDAFNRLKVEYGEYLNESGTTADDKIAAEVDADGQLKLGFAMPSNFNSSAIDALATGSHKYITYCAVSEFFNIVNKAEAADYRAMAEAELSNAKRALFKRKRPTKPSYATE